jgi:hypothetical protein
MFQRLVSTKPVYKHKSLMKFASDSNKYKANILQTKGIFYLIQFTMLIIQNWLKKLYQIINLNLSELMTDEYLKYLLFYLSIF